MEWPCWGIWSPAGHSLQPVPWPPSSPGGQVSWRAPGRRTGSSFYLTLHLRNFTPPLLSLTHWPAVACGRGHCGANQWLSRTTNGTLVTTACKGGMGVMVHSDGLLLRTALCHLIYYNTFLQLNNWGVPHRAALFSLLPSNDSHPIEPRMMQWILIKAWKEGFANICIHICTSYEEL